jgi:hypothetical protein
VDDVRGAVELGVLLGLGARVVVAGAVVLSGASSLVRGARLVPAGAVSDGTALGGVGVGVGTGEAGT